MLTFHWSAVVIATFFQYRDEVECQTSGVLIPLFMGINCLRDDFVEFSIGKNAIGLTMSVYFSHILFVLENFFMILLFYFNYHLNAWYFLPVTVCVCVFSAVGSTMRIYLLRWLRKRPVGG